MDMKNLLEKIDNGDWEKYWSGRWSLNTAALFGYDYTHLLKKQMGRGFPKALFISKNGTSACFFDKTDRKAYGTHLCKRILKDKRSVKDFCSEIKQKADELVSLAGELKNRYITKKEYSRYVDLFNRYTGLHISPRHIIDFLPKKDANKILDDLADVRIYTEKVFVETEEMMKSFASKINEKIGYSPDLILCMLPEEFKGYLETGKLPKKEELEKRFDFSLYFITSKDSALLIGEHAKKAESAIYKTKSDGQISGNPAYPGKVTGRVKIVFHPKRATDFNQGDVLVTGMTRPQFVPLMEKAAAIVTDSGGVLCHAAIVAREIKKPCIVGTQVATKIFKDGDLVEVDANKGIVRKIKN